ncbi:hypothetical protein [Bacillus sp. JJ722]|uniref:hypothetical protein n=1 Tax=Bacillus sp. JJ722 TaxID=3122973 RepID=UPI002FFF5C61
MKIQIICEKCNVIAELNSSSWQNSNINSINDYFRVQDGYDTSIDSNISNSFIQKIVDANEEEVEGILERDMLDQIEVDEKLDELEFICNKCGDSISLNSF